MKYDFDAAPDRSRVNSLKWDIAPGELPMWVADMDFDTAPAIREAILKRAGQGAYGYNIVPDAYAEAFIDWWQRRHGVTYEKEWFLFSTGVVPSLSSIVRKMTTVGEKVLLLTPVYNIFYNSVLNNGRQVLESRLIYDGKSYSIDWEDLTAKISDPQTSLFIFCNPQNPTGNIWDKETLAKIGELCAKNHVLVVSDEVHCDLLDPGYSYVPYASVSEVCLKNSITLVAASKTFNIAGLQASAVIVADENLRHKVNRGLNTDEVAEPNTFAVGATIAAFNDSEEWLEELREYLNRNKEYVRKRLAEELPEISVVLSHATYLMWLDCRRVCADTDELAAFIRKDTGLYLSAGGVYGGDGSLFLRLNIACPKSMVEDGVNRLVKAVGDYRKLQTGAAR